eukprot:TRINITY_DN3941_c0_g2_i4.p1 TRINITY_DN3941_c0_g2~~TRINITY_DN3941_c0_g2_i4.p1  ORF type:complete len:950 (+),score=186.01 TRINITY_DN3941_c0_g2_i4:52-2850(+)
MENLGIIFLNNNLLNGSLPSTYCNASSLNLGYNHLEGTIPDCTFIPPDPDITYLLDVSYNTISGSIPSSFLYNLTNSFYLTLNYNNLSGTLPPQLLYSTAPSLLSISGNPLDINMATLLSQSTLLDFIANDMTHLPPWQLPPSISPTFEEIEISNSNLGGNVPSNMFATFMLSTVILSNNQLEGTLPDAFNVINSNLEILYFDNNQLTGQLPPSLGKLAYLTTFFAQNNNFTGTLPPFIGADSVLNIDVSHNMIGGEIPPGIYGFLMSPAIQRLQLNNNNLSGTVPSMCWDLTELYFLDLSYNPYLGGVLDDTIDHLVAPGLVLNMSHCSIEGELIPSIFDLNFIVLDLSNNQLNGSLPLFVNISDRSVWLQGNLFCTPVPPWCGNNPRYASCHPPDSSPHPALCNPENNVKTGVVFVTFLLGTFLIVGVVVMGVCYIRNRPKYMRIPSDEEDDDSSLFLHNVHIGDEIGSGAHGRVFQGEWQGVTVALKTIREDTLTLQESVIEEAHIMHKLTHPNIVMFFGLYKDLSCNRTFIVTQYMPLGSLDHLLQRRGAGHRYSMQHRLQMCRDVAAGMVQLEEKGIVHCDLACRNLLVGSSYTICVSDFGLSRKQDIMQMQRSSSNGNVNSTNTPDPVGSTSTPPSQSSMTSFTTTITPGNPSSTTNSNTTTNTTSTTPSPSSKPSSEWLLGNNSTSLPIRWCSPEVIIRCEFSSKSDVWSYAVTMWEIIHLAKLPYEGMTNQEVFEWITTDSKNRLAFSPDTPMGIIKLASRCWMSEPADRPSFRDILTDLDACINKSYQDIIEDAVSLSSSSSSTSMSSMSSSPLPRVSMGDGFPTSFADKYSSYQNHYQQQQQHRQHQQRQHHGSGHYHHPRYDIDDADVSLRSITSSSSSYGSFSETGGHGGGGGGRENLYDTNIVTYNFDPFEQHHKGTIN